MALAGAADAVLPFFTAFIAFMAGAGDEAEVSCMMKHRKRD